VDSAGTPVTDGSVTATATVGATSVTVLVSATSAACNGTYRVRITVTSGSATESTTANVTVSGATDCAATGDLTVSGSLALGAQLNAAGSSLDIDAFTVYTSAAAKTNAADVDLIVGYSFAEDTMKFGSPLWATNNQLAVADGWALYNTCEFYQLSGTVALSGATTAELQAAWSAASLTRTSVTAAPGVQYITVTSEGAIAVIQVDAVTNGESGGITVRVARTAAGVETAPVPQQPTTLTTTDLSVGADENPTLGSSIDLDVPRVMLASQASASAATVDLVYAYSFATDSDKLGSPLWARDNVTFTQSWSTHNDTKFYKLTATTFEDITTADDLAALWDESNAVATSVDVVAGDVVIAETDQGVLALIKIVSQDPGSTGKIEIKVAE
jgi:hypothetical protein